MMDKIERALLYAAKTYFVNFTKLLELCEILKKYVNNTNLCSIANKQRYRDVSKILKKIITPLSESHVQFANFKD
jgi:hypothetical protein